MRLHGWAYYSEPLLCDSVISTKISCAGQFTHYLPINLIVFSLIEIDVVYFLIYQCPDVTSPQTDNISSS